MATMIQEKIVLSKNIDMWGEGAKQSNARGALVYVGEASPGHLESRCL